MTPSQIIARYLNEDHAAAGSVMARGIIDELERHGYVIVRPSDSPADPFAQAYAGSGKLRLEAQGDVIHEGDE
jgi:hypothetical protein